MFFNRNGKNTAVHKELQAVERKEKKLYQTALKAKPAQWKQMLTVNIPAKAYAGLESAFEKGFSLVFQQGRPVIEKSYHKKDIQGDHAVRDYAVQVKGRRKDLKQLRKFAEKRDRMNLAATTLEGIGLGALGVGMPDIVLFLGTLLKGVYETALAYGFTYESRQEQLLILKMMETALTTGEDWARKNRAVDEMLILETPEITDDVFLAQLRDTSGSFAMDMLILKFIQGIPVVGVLGGAANPVYYNKVMQYVKLKYRKRYLLNQEQ